jgi:Fe-coproporphyrin III synthase
MPALASDAVGSAALTQLPILILNVHSQCNCRCVMCDIWQRPDSLELPVADLERHRQSLISLGVRQVVLTGGEPLLHRNLPALCAFFRDLNIRVTLLTTGLLLHARAAQIAAGIDEVIVSLDGPPAVHNAIRNIPRAFETTAKGIATLQEIAPAIRISCRTTVQKLNHTRLRATVESAQSLHLASISFLPADLSSTAFNRERSWEPSRQDQIALNHSELAELEDEIESLIAEHQPLIESRFIAESAPKLRRLATRFREHLEPISPVSPRCNALFVSTVMELDGSLRPCFFHPPVASTTNQTLAEALNSESAQAFRKHLDVATNPTCQRCVCSLNYQPPSEAFAAEL